MKKISLFLLGTLLTTSVFATELMGGHSKDDLPSSLILTAKKNGLEAQLTGNTHRYSYFSHNINENNSSFLRCSFIEDKQYQGLVFQNIDGKSKQLNISDTNTCLIALQCLATGAEVEFDLNPREESINSIHLDESCPNYLLPDDGIYRWAEAEELISTENA